MKRATVGVTVSMNPHHGVSAPNLYPVARRGAAGALTIPSRGALRQIHKVQFIKRTLKIDGTLVSERRGEEGEGEERERGRS